MSTNVGAISATLTLEDLLTKPADRARDALGRFAKQSNETKTQLDKLPPSIAKTAQSLDELGGKLTSIGQGLTFSLSAPITAFGLATIKAGKDFESSFAGVRKTVDATEAEFQQLSNALRALAAGPDAIPIDVNELNAVAESAGQLGIAKNDIIEFTRVMANLGQTTNLTSNEASEAIAQFQNAFGAAGKEVDRFGSTLVALGNAGASTEKSILEMGVRIAGAGKQIGLTQGQVLAIASSLSSVGIEAEAGGSAISKVLISMSIAAQKGGKDLQNFAVIAGMSADEFRTAFQTDAAGALESFIKGMGRMKASGESVLLALDKMGISEVRMRDALLRVAGAGDLLTDSLKLQGEAWRDNTALTEEARKRYETFDSQLQLFWNRIKDVGITLGMSLIPALNDMLTAADPVIDVMKMAVDIFASLPDPVKIAVVAFAGLAAAVGPVVFTIGQLLTSWGTIITMAPRMGAALTVATGPWGILATAIISATIALSGWITKWKNEMSVQIDEMITDTNRLGKAWEDLKRIREGGGIVSESEFTGIKDELASVTTELIAANRELNRSGDLVPVDNLKQFSAMTPEVAAGFKSMANAQQEMTRETTKDKAELAAHIRVLEERKGVLEKQLASVKQVIPVEEELGATTGKTTDIIGDSTNSIDKRIEQLRRQAEAGLSLLDSVKRSPDAYIAEQRAQAQANEVLAARLELEQKQLSLSPQLEKVIRDLTGSIFDSGLSLERYNDLLGRVAENLTKSRDRVAGFRGLLDGISLDSNSKSIDSFVRSLSSSSLAIKIMKAELAGLAPESLAFKNLQEQIATETQAANDALSEGALRILAWRDAQSDGAKSGQASVGKEIQLIKERNKVMSEGGVLGVRDLDRQREVNAQVSDLLSRIKKGAGETAAEWTTRWLAAAKEIRATLEKQPDIELAFDLKNSLRTVWDDFNDLTEDVNRLLGEGLLTEDQARKITARAHPVFGQMLADLENGFESATTAIADGLVEAAAGGKNALDDMVDSLETTLKRMIADWLAQWFKAMAQWLARWIATQRAAQAASATTMGGGGGGAGSFGSLFGMAGQAMGGGAGGASAGMGTAASIGAVVAIYAAVYIGVSKWIDSHKKNAAQVTFQLNKDAGAAVNDIHGNTRKVRGLTDSIKKAGDEITDFLNALGGELDGLSDKVTIGSKGRGKNTSFFVELEGGIKKWFETYEEAVEGALLAALKSSKVSGFSPLMQQGLNEIDADSLDDLNEFLGDLKQISELDWTDSARQVQSATSNFLKLWESLDKLDTVTPEVLASFDQLGAGIVNAFQSWFDRIEGREKPKSKEDQLAALQAEAKIANAQKHLMEARIKAEIFDLEAEKRILEARVRLMQAGIDTEGADLRNKHKLTLVRYDQIVTEQTLEQQRIEFINAQIAALGEILANLPKDIDIPSLKLPKLGGIGGSDPFASLKEFIRDRRFELSLRGLSDYRRTLKELDRDYAERIKEAKGNKKLEAELLDLKREERRQLNEDKRNQTLGDIDSFLGVKTGFDEIRDTAGKLIDDINDSPFGDARKAALIGKVLAGLDRQLDDLAKKSASSLFGEMLGDLEKFGVDQALQTEVRKNLAILEHTLKMEHYRAEIEILRREGRLSAETMALLDRSLAELQKIDPTKLFGPPANDNNDGYNPSWWEAQDEARRAMEDAAKKLADSIKSATDKLRSYQEDELSPFAQRMKEINADFDEIIKALGSTPEVIAAFNNAIDRAKDDARDLLSGYTDSGRDPLELEIERITRDFETIREALGDTPEVLEAFSDAIDSATKKAYEALVGLHDDLTGGAGLGSTIEQQFNAAKKKLEETMAAVRGGDTSRVADLAAQGKAFEDLLGKRFGTSTGGFIEGKDKLAAEIRAILAGAGILGTNGTISNVLPFVSPATTPAELLRASSIRVGDLVKEGNTNQERLLVDIRDFLRQIRDNTGAMANNTVSTPKLSIG